LLLALRRQRAMSSGKIGGLLFKREFKYCAKKIDQ
jgi:hypothetical protein